MAAGGNMEGVVTAVFADDGTFPNSRLPLLIYRKALSVEAATPETFEALFEGNGWPPVWRSSRYIYHHYHSTAHECLGIASGEAKLQLGGPEGAEFDVVAGDVIVIPAGVGHQRLYASPDFLVVGAYPPGQDWDLLRGGPDDRPAADSNIARVALPETDPVGGIVGAVLDLWRG